MFHETSISDKIISKRISWNRNGYMRTFLKSISAIGDYALLIFTLTLVVHVRTDPRILDTVYKEYLIIFIPLFFVWLFVFRLFDLYNFDAPPKFAKFFFCLCLVTFLSMLIFYIFPHRFQISPKTNLVLFAVTYSLFFYFWRRFIEILFIKFFHGHEIMMAISDDDALFLAITLYKKPRYKYTIKGVLVTKEFYLKATRHLPHGIVYQDSEEFEKAIKRLGIRTIVSSSLWFARLYGTMYELLPRAVRIINVINFHERVLGYIPVHSTSQYWIMNNFDLVARRIYMGIKQVLDILFACFILPFLLLLMLGVIVALKLFGEDGAPVFFKQKRVGMANKEFTLVKFRTMYMNAEKHGAQWATENDPRVTKIGRILRLTRLDEIPQIFNILKGEMSFIGPRPERMEFVKNLVKDIPHYHIRHIVKPGLSGWAQVKFRYASSTEDAAVKLCYDLYYIKNIGFTLDARIFIQTIITVLTAAGQ